MAEIDLAVARVQVSRHGPYRVSGNLPLATQLIGASAEGDSVEWRQGRVFPRARQYALCRCGHSAHKPFCDGAHTRVAFVGTETASRAAYSEEAKNVQGSDDVADRFECSVRIRPLLRSQRIGVETRARHRGAGPARANLMRQCGDCPSGRLVAWDNQTGKAVEAECELSIGLIEDPARRCSGPIWLRGGVRLFAADGFQYQVRNRMTLCRCGASKNKPFCDGSHQSIGFSSEG